MTVYSAIYFIDTSVLLENTPLFHAKLQPGLEWRILRILTCEDIDNFTVNCT